MNYQDFSNLAGGISSIATVLALAIGGFWTYHRFVKQREKFPFIEFTVDIVPIGKQAGYWIVELVAFIENKGKVQHKIRDFSFDLAALAAGDEVTTSTEFGGQIHFKREVKKGSWLPKHAQFFFIDPGVKAKYSYLAQVPEQSSFLNLHASFRYTDQNAFHSAERTIEIGRDVSDRRTPES